METTRTETRGHAPGAIVACLFAMALVLSGCADILVAPDEVGDQLGAALPLVGAHFVERDHLQPVDESEPAARPAAACARACEHVVPCVEPRCAPMEALTAAERAATKERCAAACKDGLVRDRHGSGPEVLAVVHMSCSDLFETAVAAAPAIGDSCDRLP